MQNVAVQRTETCSRITQRRYMRTFMSLEMGGLLSFQIQIIWDADFIFETGKIFSTIFFIRVLNLQSADVSRFLNNFRWKKDRDPNFKLK